MAYDRDGTQGYTIDAANVIAQMTSTQIANLNDESGATGAPFAPYVVLYFPERRDLVAWWIDTSAVFLVAALEVSTNTTNGLDGTWTQVGPNVPVPSHPSVAPYYRDGIISATSLGIKALRIKLAGALGGFSTLHLYGNPSAGQNPNRLAIWHPTTDTHVTGPYFDWGDVPRSSSQDRTFRVKNLSPTLNAVGIGLGLEALTDTAPSVPGQHTLSTDGTTFTATISISDLAPGGISPVLTMRRVTPTNATLGTWAGRLFAQATSWS
jgi:hypothetical protein